MTDPLHDRIVRAFAAEESPLRDAGAALLVDHVLGLPLRDIVDLEEVKTIVLSAFTEENVERIVTRHVKPGWHRYAASVERSGETVGGLVPEPAVDEIRKIVEKLRLPRAAWAEGMIDPSLMRRLFAPVWANLLFNFAKKIPMPGVGAASGAAAAASSAVGRGIGGVAGRLTRSVQERAEKIVDAGRTVMGGLGAEVEKRMQSTAREFSEGAQTIFKDALRDRLKSEEGRELVEQMTRQAIDHVMVTKLKDLHADTARFPMDDVFAVTPKVVAHAVTRPFVRKIVTDEVLAFVALEGERPLGDMLGELGLLESVRALANRRGSELFRGAAQSQAFRDWVARLLEEA